MGMSYLTPLNPQLFKNIAYVGSFEHSSVQLFFTCILQLDQDSSDRERERKADCPLAQMARRCYRYLCNPVLMVGKCYRYKEV